MDPDIPSYVKIYNSDKDKNYGVRVFWEIDTAPLEDAPEASTIFENITKSLQKANPDYFIRMVTIYGDFSLYGGTSIFQKMDLEFDLVIEHMPKRLSICLGTDCRNATPPKDQLAAHCLKQDMNCHTIMNDPPFNVMVITSDPSFEDIITTLYDRGFVMLLVCDFWTLFTVGKSAYYKWYWDHIKRGDDPLVPDGTFLP